MDEREPYVNKQEAVSNSLEATAQIAALLSYSRDAKAQRLEVGPFKALGAQLLASRYESKHSQWVFPDSADVKEREKQLDDRYTAIDQAYTIKLALLQDHKERELYREGVMLQAQQHVSSHATLKVL